MEIVERWAPEDPLGVALHSLRMRGAFYCRSQLTSPWGLALPPMPGYLWFHVITSGRCWLEAEDGAPRLLRPGDVALVPHGDGHCLRSETDAVTTPILEVDREQVSERYEVLRHGGGGEGTNLVCAAVRFDHPAAFDVIRLLPCIVHVETAQSLQPDLMQSTLRLMADEARELRPGGETVITRLSDVLVVQAIRWWIETDVAARTGWLAALRDSQIGRAITLIHQDPARDWTVALLASEVAMSRSAFAARFTELVGEPAITYVARWRMHLALDALHGGATVSELADRLGYRSVAAFSRAFKRIMAISPGAVSRHRPGIGAPVT